MGLAKISCRYAFWLVKLVWKALFLHLEFSSVVPNVVYLEGA